MTAAVRSAIRHFAASLCALALLAFAAPPAVAGEYAALEGVKGLDSVFDVTLDSPAAALVIFPAIRGVYKDPSVHALHAPPRTVIVFHGGAVRLISTDRQGLEKKERQYHDEVAEMIHQFKKDGVRMEVCMYAVKALGVDPATIMPEIDRVGNGFISVLGYQAQGYALVRIP